MTASALGTLPPLRDVIAQHGLAARKGLGQHFLLDLNLTRKIVATAGDLSDVTVFEIGPGPGGLTRALLASNAKQIIAIEKDPRCLPALQELQAVSAGRLTFRHDDALQVDLTALALAPRVIIANLPYNVATPMLINWLRQGNAFRTLTLMFQAEVVERLVAVPGTKAYGRLAVLAQFCCDVKRVMHLPAKAFTPAPNVDSAVAQFTPRAELPAGLVMEDLETITAAAFGQRRKMLRSAVQPLGGEALLNSAEINPERRAETLSIAEFVDLTRVWVEKFKQ
jgi:16S rRNA (adenine1518-N6/adenine1519-N6)-dimethyltransferase